jgi:PAS domain S-box-containing protein
MNQHIRILHLEDSRFDADIAEREMRTSKIPYELLWVTNKQDFGTALEEFRPDIILSDHSLPSFSSVQALKMVREHGVQVPFILITGTVSEEFAVDMIHKGVSDYLLKDRMQRLPTAIINALNKFKAEKEKQEYFDRIVQNENRYRTLIENISDGILLINSRAEFIYQSASVGRITGYNSEELVGKTLFDMIYEDDRDDAQHFLINISKEYGVTHLRQYRIRNREGKVIWVEGTIVNKLDDENIRAFIITYRDITERKQVEASNLELIERLQKKNNELRQFAYIVSHDLRAPIAKIQGLVTILQEDDDDAESKMMIQDYIFTEVENLDHVVSDMNEIITVGDSSQMKNDLISFEDKLSKISLVLKNEISESGAVISYDFNAAPYIVSVQSYIYSIMYNLLSNALKYSANDRKPEISLLTFKSGDFNCLSVSDNGIGIDLKKDGDKIFQLYKKAGVKHADGRGIGLHMLKIQVEALGGYIEVDSNMNSGSTFRVFLPCQVPDANAIL